MWRKIRSTRLQLNYYNKYGEDQLGTALIFPYTDDREIPGMVRQVVNALHELLWIPIVTCLQILVLSMKNLLMYYTYIICTEVICNNYIII